ncbi:Rossmann-like domain-containing protein [Methylovulum miyakonense]|uniref:Rossmann-like domain-containing protein n=1 Tax=Methylovulum miyakonense TaxID=645578 RepID=UPI00036B4753
MAKSPSAAPWPVELDMHNPQPLYELLLDSCSSQTKADKLMIGLVWTLCQDDSQGHTGLAMSPGVATRTLPWSGTLAGKPVTDLAAWILDWEPYKATVAMAAINCCLNSRPLPESVLLEHHPEHPNLAVFDHFLPQLQGKNVVVIGHYPGIERYQNQMRLTVLEKQPTAGDLPDAASEFLLPNADWVFLTASSIPNKTFPRLAELSGNAKTVLMGPTVPWLPQLHEFGIDYLAGVEVTDANALYHTAAQGGGVRIFQNGVRYRIAQLTPATSLAWLKRQIADCAAERLRLTAEMENWYNTGNTGRYPAYRLLEEANARLSRLDSSYKLLWDSHGTPTNRLA